MKPSQIKVGQRVLLCPNGRGADMGKMLPATVVWHDASERNGRVMTALHVDAYAGLMGPDDKGEVNLTRHHVIHLLLQMGRDGRPVADALDGGRGAA